MKRGLSPLERMRLARDQREQAVLAPVVAPLQVALKLSLGRVEGLQESLETMSSVVTSEIGPRLTASLLDLVVERVERNIFEAMCKAGGARPGDIITVALSTDMVMFARPNEAAKKVLDKAAETYRTETRAVAMLDPAAYVTRLRVTIPEVNVEVTVPQDSLERKRVRA